LLDGERPLVYDDCAALEKAGILKPRAVDIVSGDTASDSSQSNSSTGSRAGAMRLNIHKHGYHIYCLLRQ
jgi:hypothetical protein